MSAAQLHLVGGDFLENFLDGCFSVDDHLQATVPEGAHATGHGDLLDVAGWLFEHHRLTDILIADANTGWLAHDAARVVRGVRDVDVYIEQPCERYEDCLSIRRRTDHPFILDENIEDMSSLLRAKADDAMDVVNVKISKFGGLTKASLARNFCVEAGLGLTIEDTWGGDIVTAAISHLAHSTPTEHLFTSTDFNSYVTVSIADGAPKRKEGRMAASSAPGLGVEPRADVLGSPLFSLGLGE